MTDQAPVALVTGASRGIGRAIAALLVRQGYAVTGTSRAPQPAEDGIEFLPCDVTDAAQVARLFGVMRERHGHLDVLVNNAALAGGAAFGSEAEAAEWGPIIATNLTGTWACSRAAGALLRDGRGRIVNIASILGLRGVADQLAYSASKHGVIGLTRSLARALGPRGITANAVCPGWVGTRMALDRLQQLGMSPAQAVALTPTGRFSEPEEVASLVGFLASEAAANITGQALSIDGGALA
ncbi:MAG: SDR family oxidoreductase [Variovorax sp.]|nr:SDR family oxidoreductase [Variovorax sp.]